MGFNIIFAGLDIYLSYKNIYSNYTVSKTFVTMLLLGYLKHYDGFILSHNKTNKTLDFIAKYSFGIFFIHWYWIFIYNQITGLQGVIPVDNIETLPMVLITVFIRFLAVTGLSILTLLGFKEFYFENKSKSKYKNVFRGVALAYLYLNFLEIKLFCKKDH